MWPFSLINWTLIKNTLFGEGYVWQWWILITLLLSLGFVQFIKFVLGAIKFSFRNGGRWTNNFYEDYRIKGKEPYVVVTGGSDGIGFEIAQMMAARKFSVVIIARNQEKMDKKVAELKKMYPKNNYMTIAADFSKMFTIKEYRETIGQKLKDIDVTMLFLNAGVAQMGPFAEIDDSSVQDLMAVNALHPMFLAKVLVNQMLLRERRSAIVVTSSAFGQRPIGGASIVYSATKSLVSFLGVGLSYELESKIDVMAWEAGEVATNMSKKKAGFMVLAPKEAVRSMLRDIGKERITDGDTTHEIFNGLLRLVPLYYANQYFIGLGAKVLKKQRARAPQVVDKKNN